MTPKTILLVKPSSLRIGPAPHGQFGWRELAADWHAKASMACAAACMRCEAKRALLARSDPSLLREAAHRALAAKKVKQAQRHQAGDLVKG